MYANEQFLRCGFIVICKTINAERRESTSAPFSHSAFYKSAAQCTLAWPTYVHCCGPQLRTPFWVASNLMKLPFWLKANGKKSG